MRLAILGGGISGLSAAWYFLKQEPNAQITLFEASNRLGGWIESKREGPFLFELGPRTFQTEKCPELLQMIKELGLEVVYSGRQRIPKFLWVQGQLRSIGSFWPQLLRAGIQDLMVARKTGQEDESIHDFAKRRMGKQAAELFFDAMARGVYGGDIKKLSIQACFPSLFEMEQKERSLVKGMLKSKGSSLFTLRQGMGSLIEALQNALPIQVHLNTPVEKFCENGVFAAGRFWPADLIISALPGPEIARLTNTAFTLRNEPITVVNCGYHGEILQKRGYGYLMPSNEGGKILGQIWDTSIFPVRGQTKITSMTRGSLPIETATHALAQHLHITRPPAAIAVKDAQIPQYDVGHLLHIKQFEQEIDSRFRGKLKLTGNYLFGVSVEACLQRSKRSIYR